MTKAVLVFTGGAGIGFGVSWFVLKRKFEKDLEAESQAVREAYGKRIDELKASLKAESHSAKEETLTAKEAESDAIQRANADKTETPMEYMEKQAKNRETVDYSKFYKGESTKQESMMTDSALEEDDKIYIIQENELDDRDCISLTLYEDGVVTNENGEVIEDVDGLLGDKFVARMQISAEDAVLVRNDMTYLDYEVCAAGVRFDGGKPLDPDGEDEIDGEEVSIDDLQPDDDKPHLI